MTRVLHTGDTHIGYRQYHSPERRADFLAAFRRVVEDAIEADVDAVVHAGDLFHDRRPALADIHGTIEVLRELKDADIPLLAVVGNHERTRGQQWLDLFETLGLATRLGREPHPVGDVALYGLDFVPRSRREALSYEFAPHDLPHAALVAHGLFEPFAHADWDTRQLIEAATVEFDAMLLGDNHDPGTERVVDTWVTYCGSTERVDATEREARGYNLVTFDGDVTITRRGIETRPFAIVDVDLTPGEGIDRIRDRLAEESLEDAVVLITISGDGDPISPAEVETFALDRGALVARVADRREFEAADVGTVQFVDPDQAIEARLRGLGLSDAALAVDELVRDEDVPKTNVRDRVKDHVLGLLEDDPSAFEPAEDVGPSPETMAETPGVGHTAGPNGIGGDGGSDAPPADEAGGSGAGKPSVPSSRTTATTTRETGTGDATTSEDDDTQTRSGSDRQVTMEDYL